MPIFEFKCVDCGHVFEKIFMRSDEEVSISCPACQCESIERVVSRTNYMMGASPGGNQPKLTTKSCGSGNECYSIDLPGHSK